MCARGVPQPSGWSSPGDEREYQRPFSWWGFGWTQPEPRSLPWLIHSGTITTREAAFLSLAIESRRTVIIAAEPPKAGKTTLLTALVDFLDPAITPIYLRGIYERFEFLSEVDPTESYILCNEISAHLPTYLWGRGVRILFDALTKGFTMATTMHAPAGQHILDKLRAYPLDVPADHTERIDLVVILDMNYVDNHLVRRVTGIDRIDGHGDQVSVQQLSHRDRLRTSPSIALGRMIRTLGSWLGIDDERASSLLIRRERFLDECVRSGRLGVDQVREALRVHRGGQD